ncbi:hypothetical protein LR48_Vigan02g223700 [Vigna angularis]|uniref:Uncharacterized protein n=2 Tax=Phaseolus angularis TaxID=3914 RepID=A0A0L9U0A3_PHAAN|nr:uncharacterized protein HKW66_Vig0194980 [Vigna angularis]KOM36087.1 hypothetical protein LR48_Vigan02g223700 [Vigna angularis]BAT94090.1 hypothetical protein VIGAN_08066000 [Vigna angularis var. angularis]
MANKYVAVLLVVCLMAAASVDGQETQLPCFEKCVSFDCGENPSNFCKFLCGFGCSAAGMSTNLVEEPGLALAEAPGSSLAEAPQFPRKVKAPLVKD